MNLNEATIAQCWEGIYRFKGWSIDETSGEWWHPNHPPMKELPTPTLDAIAASLPEGCCWCFIGVSRSEIMVAEVISNDGFAYRAYADTELLARARAVCLALEASAAG